MSFERLGSALQYQIATTLGFQSLRPVQNQTIDAVLDGANCVVLAPTAGGKTEAAFFPVISEIDRQNAAPVSVIYLSPIRALLNNQEERVQRYAGLVGRRVTKWHGDITERSRKAFLAHPTDILLTTPESLEAMFLGSRVRVRDVFAGLRYVIVDEVHAFAGDDRGAHLSAILERLAEIAGRDVQRLGLSATVGNPEEILTWLQGSSKRERRLVDPGGARVTPSIEADFVGNVANAARVIALAHPGQKRLAFTDSRRSAEELGKALLGQGVRAFVTHGSLSLTERKEAEQMFAQGEDCVIVATSVLELGVDVGDLDRVIQLDAPSSVASFLQRMGRTGRRDGTTPNCTFLCTKDPTLVQALAIVTLSQRGWVESVAPPRAAAHVFAHQVMALAIEREGVRLPEVEQALKGAAAFTELDSEARRAIADHMLQTGILADYDGRLWLGPEGEKRYGYANFRELYAVFDAPRLLKVMHHATEIGTVDAYFIALLLERPSPDRPGLGAFVLGARPWQLQHVDWTRGLCTVVPADDARAPRWAGGPRFLSRVLCREIRALLIGDDEPVPLTARAKRALATERALHAFLKETEVEAPLVEAAAEVSWWTFAGGAANLLLARMLAKELGEKVFSTNFRVTFREGAASSIVRVRDTIEALREAGRPSDEDALAFASEASKTRLSKFEPCLPPAKLQALQARTLFDLPSARAALSASRTTG